MRRYFSRFLIAAMAGSFPLGADAGTVTGTVEIIQTGSGSTAEGVYGLVTINATASGQPSCAADQRFAFNPGTAEGKSFLALLLSAQASGKSVAIFGNDNCNITGLPANERISYMRLIT